MSAITYRAIHGMSTRKRQRHRHRYLPCSLT